MSLWVYAMCIGDRGGQKRQLGPLAVVSHPTCVLGLELGFSARAAGILNHSGMSTASRKEYFTLKERKA